MNENPERRSQVNMKSKVDPSQINKNQLNSSPSKMQYSIPRSPRFPDPDNRGKTTSLYDIPAIKTNRSTSFGYGNKMDLSKQNFQKPPPTHYNIQSQFTTGNKKGITIAAGRQVIKTNSAFESPKQQPGPGQYSPNDPLMKPNSQNGFTIGQKIPDLSDKWIKSIPGPGGYQTMQLLDKNLKSKNSRIQNAPSLSFSKSKRNSDFEQRIKQKIPGPGLYKSQKTDGRIAKFPAMHGHRFSSYPRQGIISENKPGVPGPGAQYL